MAIVHTQIASGADKTAEASLASGAVTEGAAVGDLILVVIAADNAGTNGVSSITAPTDSTGTNTYTLVKEQNRTAGSAAADGCTISIYQSVLTAALTINVSTVTANFSPNTTAKAFSVHKITGAHTTNYSTDFVSGTGTTYTLPTSASMATGDLYFGAVANESATPAVVDSDTTNGSWVSGTFNSGGTGGDATKMALLYEYKIVTGSGTQSASGNTGASTDYAGVFALYQPEASPTVALNTPTDTATGQSLTPNLLFTGTDANADEVEYQVLLDNKATFDSNSNISHASGTNDGNNIVGGTGSSGESNQAFGQTFTTVGAITATSFDVKIMKTGAPTDNLTIYLRSTSDTGTVLGSGTINGVNLTTSEVVHNFVFSSPISLAASTTYYITYERDGARDSINYYRAQYSTNDSYSGGTARGRTNNSWTDFGTTNDLYFVIYTPLLDILSSTESPSHFTGTGDPHPWPSGNQITYAVQAGVGLLNSTVYYWKVRAIDPLGSNTYGAWPTAFSFTTAAGGAPAASPNGRMTTNTLFWGT